MWQKANSAKKKHNRHKFWIFDIKVPLSKIIIYKLIIFLRWVNEISLRKIIEILIGEWLEWKGLSKKMNKLIKCVKIRKACLEWN